MPTLFEQKVYDACARIPMGRVSTYKELGNFLNISGQGYRAVGRALNKNPFAPGIPCHRVVCSDGFIGGFASGTSEKERLLKIEGIRIIGGKISDFEKVFFKF